MYLQKLATAAHKNCGLHDNRCLRPTTDLVARSTCLCVAFGATSGVEGPLAPVCAITLLPILETNPSRLWHSFVEVPLWDGPTLHDGVRWQTIVCSFSVITTRKDVNANVAVTYGRINRCLPHRVTSETTEARGIFPGVCLKLGLILRCLKPESVTIQLCCELL